MLLALLSHSLKFLKTIKNKKKSLKISWKMDFKGKLSFIAHDLAVIFMMKYLNY